jgi:hypothetical protein
VEVDDSRSKPVEERIENALVKVKRLYIFLYLFCKKSIQYNFGVRVLINTLSKTQRKPDWIQKNIHVR